MDQMLQSWTHTLEDVFPTVSSARENVLDAPQLFKAKKVYHCRHKVAKPKVFIPVFPGTNCEYDSARAFLRAGADVETIVFRNQNAAQINESVAAYAKAIDESQIVMIPGGFSAGDEPEGSAKFITSVFRNGQISDAVMRLLKERDGLMLGICNGFQALVKLGLVPYGEICQQQADSPTLTFNTIGRHQSMIAHTRVVSNLSPWLQQAELGKSYVVPISHGEGRFVAPQQWLHTLFANGQVATQYVDLDGRTTMAEPYNMNGSYMAIEGITSPDGRVLGKMGHSERRADGDYINIYGDKNQMIMESGVEYFL
jgi:phosphoribosylformylglycinamidine synthase